MPGCARIVEKSGPLPEASGTRQWMGAWAALGATETVEKNCKGAPRLLLTCSNPELPALPRDQKVLPDGYQQGKDSPEGGLVLGKAEGTLLTGASLSKKTEAADGLVPGCLAHADKIPQASEPMAEERDLEGSCWEDTMLWCPVPPGCVGGMEELRRG